MRCVAGEPKPRVASSPALALLLNRLFLTLLTPANSELFKSIEVFETQLGINEQREGPAAGGATAADAQ